MSVQLRKSSRRVRGAAVAKTASAAAISQTGQPQAPAAERLSKIAVAAYYIAERRGFVAGHELDDWLAAETEIDGSELPSLVTSMEISAEGTAS